MKKVILILVTILGITVNSHAQKAKGQRGGNQGKKINTEEKVNYRTDKMKESLGLSDDQYKQVLALNSKMADEMKASRQKIKGNYQNELKGILTPEQYAKFEEFKGNKHQDKDPKEMAQRRTDKMKSELNLTDEQYRKVLALNTLEAEKIKNNHEATRDAMKKDHEQYRDSLKSILTPEQFEKLKQQRQEGGKKIHRKGDK